MKKPGEIPGSKPKLRSFSKDDDKFNTAGKRFRGCIMKWFKMPHDFIDNPRVGSMSQSHQLIWVKLLYLANINKPEGFVSIPHDEAAFLLRIELSQWILAMETFSKKGLIQILDKGLIQIVDWPSRYSPTGGRLPSSEWNSLRLEIFERDGFTCQYCGAHGVELQCDHIIPVSRGGSNDPENLTTACCPCNQSKRNKTPEEWRGEV
jgi:hypothetical protein